MKIQQLKNHFFMAIIALLFCCTQLAAQGQTISLSDSQLRVQINDSGYINNFMCRKGTAWESIDFFQTGKYRGPAFLINQNVVALKKVSGKTAAFIHENDSLLCRLLYVVKEGKLLMQVSIKNKTNRILKPEQAGIKVGIDAYMEQYPQWNSKHFPTLLRCEKTHFWGYTMSPDGSIIAVASPNPVASWSIDYEGHHRIGSFNIDLLNSIPQPGRHPAGFASLKTREEKKWEIYLMPVENLDVLKPTLAAVCKAPIVDITGGYTLAPGEQTDVTVYSKDAVNMIAILPDGSKNILSKKFQQNGKTIFTFKPKSDAGVYTLTTTSNNGKQAEAKVYLRKPWSWYLEQARIATIEAPPLPAPYAEWFYNAYTTFLAKRYLPDAVLDSITNADFRAVFAKMYDAEKGMPTLTNPDHRPQWYGTMISIFTQAYKTSGNVSDLETASHVADLLIEGSQKIDDAYRAGKTHYTCVIYPAKAMLELAITEKELAANADWKERAQRHFNSGKRAVDDLVRLLDNIETEGEMTFEDGMISCSALQIGFMALLENDSALRKKYTDAAIYLLEKHRCLEALQNPDTRMIGGTFRFWEAYHDLRITPNMMNSPHGWGSWKTYATYYAYLLTGEEKWLRETMDAVGSAMQVIDVNTKKLRWGFVPDPYIKAKSLITEDPENIGTGTYENIILGEQYIDMKRYWRKYQASDNDVHEHFKMMAEVTLSNAFVLERANGTLVAYNCSVEKINNTIVVKPYEKLISNVHVNLKTKRTVKINFSSKEIIEQSLPGMKWIGVNN